MKKDNYCSVFKKNRVGNDLRDVYVEKKNVVESLKLRAYN